MNGAKILIDTNIAISLLKGDHHLSVILQDTAAYVSFVVELELLGYRAITDNERPSVQMFLSECIIIDLNDGIKEITCYVQHQYDLKLREAIIAATSIFLGIPLLSTDNRFEPVKELIFIFYEP